MENADFCLGGFCNGDPHHLCIPYLDCEYRDAFKAAILAIQETEEGKEALDTAYQWDAQMETDDSFYDPFRQVLDAAGKSPEDYQ